MEKITPVPYLPSLETARRLIRGEHCPGIPLNRTLLTPEIRLTVPVAGGSSVLKRLSPDLLEISQHGRWQHVHAGAFEACLGNTPFWRFLEPDIAGPVLEASGPLLNLNLRLWTVLTDFLDIFSNLADLREMEISFPDRIASLRGRMEGKNDPALSLLSVLSRFGRDAIFLF